MRVVTDSSSLLFFFQAGQATEPECLVAVGLAAGDDGQVQRLRYASSLRLFT